MWYQVDKATIAICVKDVADGNTVYYFVVVAIFYRIPHLTLILPIKFFTREISTNCCPEDVTTHSIDVVFFIQGSEIMKVNLGCCPILK